jgi:hypothetical protein
MLRATSMPDLEVKVTGRCLCAIHNASQQQQQQQQQKTVLYGTRNASSFGRGRRISKPAWEQDPTCALTSCVGLMNGASSGSELDSADARQPRRSRCLRTSGVCFLRLMR